MLRGSYTRRKSPSAAGVLKSSRITVDGKLDGASSGMAMPLGTGSGGNVVVGSSVVVDSCVVVGSSVVGVCSEVVGSSVARGWSVSAGWIVVVVTTGATDRYTT